MQHHWQREGKYLVVYRIKSKVILSPIDLDAITI